MTPILVFDIETVPDVAGIRRLNDVAADIPDGDVLAWYAQQRRAATGSDFAPLYLHKVVAIACAMRAGGLVAGKRWVQLVPSHSHVSFG